MFFMREQCCDVLNMQYEDEPDPVTGACHAPVGGMRIEQHSRACRKREYLSVINAADLVVGDMRVICSISHKVETILVAACGNFNGSSRNANVAQWNPQTISAVRPDQPKILVEGKRVSRVTWKITLQSLMDRRNAYAASFKEINSVQSFHDSRGNFPKDPKLFEFIEHEHAIRLIHVQYSD